jgi:hypothetical protein
MDELGPRPALLGPRHAPSTARQWAAFEKGAAAADAAWDLTGPWFNHDDMVGRDRFWVHGYWARYYERLPVLYTYEAAPEPRLLEVTDDDA